MSTAEPDWAAIRAEFPAAERVTYLNTAGGGLLSRAAAAAGRRFYDEAEAEGDKPWQRWLARAGEVRAGVARIVAGAEPDDVALVANASTGLDLAARLLPGSGAVLAFDREFPSVTLPWLARGRKLRVLPLGEAYAADLDGVDPALIDGADIIVASHVGFRTGWRLDLAALGAFARRHGLAAVADATQSVGAFPLSLPDGIDALTFSAYKWAGGGYGIGALVVAPGRRWGGRPLPAAGWRSAARPDDLRFDAFDASSAAAALELGHPPFPGAFAMGAGLAVAEGIGIEHIAARIADLVGTLHRGLDTLGLPVRSTRDPAHLSGIVIAGVANAEATQAALRDRHGVLVGRRGPDELRIALHLYNDESDIRRCLEALRAEGAAAG